MNTTVIEPITKPAPVVVPSQPAPKRDDPFNVPAPLIAPTIKGFKTSSAFN